jgi:phthalate 4,5-dioxygenase oxygenase subunit
VLSAEQNELLTRVEGSAPMGQLMRRHWLPACLSDEVALPDCTPLRARLLGEDLVIFRDTEGKLGALAEQCPHRKASLAFGRNEECGLRCLYHGWKFSVDGSVMDMASEPNSERKKNSIKHKAYPIEESGGFIWVYLGPEEDMTTFQPPAWAPSPDVKASVVKIHTHCNWAQVLEGSIDSAHSSSLHSSNMPTAEVENSTATADSWLRPSKDKSPKLEIEMTDYGFQYAALRKPIKNEEKNYYIRTTIFIAPFTVLIPPNTEYKLAQILFPIDDYNTMFYWVAWHPDPKKGISQDEWRRFCAAEVGTDLDESYIRNLNLGNWFKQDRDAMKKGHFTGIKGIPAEDMAMWESMGRIANRSHEILGSSDLSIVKFRHQMLKAVNDFATGEPAIGTKRTNTRHIDLSSFEGIVPKSTDWRALRDTF